MSSPRRALSARRQRGGLVGQRRLQMGVDPRAQVLGREAALGQLGAELLDEALVHAEVHLLEQPRPGLLGGEEGAGLRRWSERVMTFPSHGLSGLRRCPTQRSSGSRPGRRCSWRTSSGGRSSRPGTPRLTDSATTMSLGRAASTLSCRARSASASVSPTRVLARLSTNLTRENGMPSTRMDWSPMRALLRLMTSSPAMTRMSSDDSMRGQGHLGEVGRGVDHDIGDTARAGC